MLQGFGQPKMMSSKDIIFAPASPDGVTVRSDGQAGRKPSSPIAE
jgi:hypothetical protein